MAQVLFFVFYTLFTGVNGFLSPRLIHEVTHNRCVNIHGGKGRNVAMDRVNEFVNAEFKGNIN